MSELVTVCNELTLELRGSCWLLVLLQFDDVNFETKFWELILIRMEFVKLMKNLLIFVCFGKFWKWLGFFVMMIRLEFWYRWWNCGDYGDRKSLLGILLRLFWVVEVAVRVWDSCVLDEIHQVHMNLDDLILLILEREWNWCLFSWQNLNGSVMIKPFIGWQVW